jgi:hypothetical protein
MNITERDVKVGIVAAIAAFIVSVVMLDMNGYIKHVGTDAQTVVEEFKLVVVGVEAQTKVSSKSSNKEAFCADGYLLLRPQKNQSGKSVAGLLVDAKNRPVPCSRELPAPRG